MAEQKYGCSPSDRALVEGLRAGDPDVGDLLVAHYYGRILTQMLRETHNAELARDLTQDTFEIAVRHLDQLRDDNPFAAWLHGIARNRARMEWRDHPAWRFLPLDAVRRWTMPAPVGERGLVQEALSALRPADRQLLVQQVSVQVGVGRQERWRIGYSGGHE